MLRPPVPNTRISRLERCDSHELLGIFELCLKTGSRRTKYGRLPDVWGILFSRLYMSPVELVDEMQGGEHRLDGESARMLREFIKADCAGGGAFVLSVIKKGGMIDRSALIMIVDLADLASVEHDGTTAIHLLMGACDRRVRPVLITRAGSGLLSGVYDRNGMPVLLSIFGLSDLCTSDLDAIAKVFPKDELRKVMCRNRMGRSALEVFTEVSAMLEGTSSQDRNTFFTARAVRDADMDGARQVDPHVRIEGGTGPELMAEARKTSGTGNRNTTGTPVRHTSVIPSAPDGADRMMKIMIVDDDQIIRDILQVRLKILGHDTCLMAEDGDEAVRLARETKPDIIFMDISMPGKKDGIAAAREITSEMNSRIIFITGHSDPELIDRAKEVRPSGYILKPFTEADIRIALALLK